jgi:hypothetical protein
MSEEKSVKELSEALVGFLSLATVLAEQFKDGVQVEDVAPILAKLQSEPLSSKLKAAYNGIDHVPSEAGDIDMKEIFQLLPAIFPELQALIKAIKK